VRIEQLRGVKKLLDRALKKKILVALTGENHGRVRLLNRTGNCLKNEKVKYRGNKHN